MPVKTFFLYPLFACLPFLLTTGCVSKDPVPSPPLEQPPPLQFGICQPGALWQGKNFDFVQSPSSYERRSWSSALEAAHKPELLNDLGILWCRVDFSWKNMQPEQNEWYFRSMDEYLAALRDRKGQDYGLGYSSPPDRDAIRGGRHNTDVLNPTIRICGFLMPS